MGSKLSTVRRLSVDKKRPNQFELDLIAPTQRDSAFLVKFRETIVSRLAENEVCAEKDEMIPIGGEKQLMNEMVYQNIHPLSKDVGKEQQEKCLDILKKIFLVEEKEIQHMVEVARARKEPEKRINFELIEAKGFEATKEKGFSCVAYQKKCSEAKTETKKVFNNGSPTWNFKGSMPVSNSENDLLVVEVWTHPRNKPNSEEDKNKGTLGTLINFLKRITLVKPKCSGTAEISVKDIPSAGKDNWVDLNKKKRSVHLILTLGSSRDVQEACKEHRNLVRVVLRQELRKVASPFAWDGSFSEMAEKILKQHQTHSSLAPMHVFLARWAAFCDHHDAAPFNFEVLERTLTKLQDLKLKHEKLFGDFEAKLFWDASDSLITHGAELVRNLFELREVAGKDFELQLRAMLKVMSLLPQFKPPNKRQQDQFSTKIQHRGAKIEGEIIEAIRLCSQKYVDEKFANLQTQRESVPTEIKNEVVISCFSCITDLFPSKNAENSESEIGNQENSADVLVDCSKEIVNIKDCISALSPYNEQFKCLDINFSGEVLGVFDQKVYDVVRPLVLEFGKKMQNKKWSSSRDQISQDDYKTVIELYCQLKSFSKFEEVFLDGQKSKCSDSHKWFSGGVTEQWLDIIFLKGLTYIDRAIEKDAPVTDSNCSSSAFDVLEILKMLENHIMSLDVSDDKSHVPSVQLNLVEKNAKCVEYYSEKVVLKLVGVKDLLEDENTMCISMNNIEKIRSQGLDHLLNNLLIDSTFSSMNKVSSKIIDCQDTLKVLKRVVEVAKYTELKLLEIGKKLSKSVLAKFKNDELLTKFGFLNLTVAQYHYERLEKNLSEHNYNKIVSLTSNYLVKYLAESTSHAEKNDRPPIYFANTMQGIEDYEAAFLKGIDFEKTEEMKKLKLVLRDLSVDTIHKYCLEILNKETVVERSDKQGQVTCALQLKNNGLKIKGLNASNLKSNKNGGTCSPYMEIELHPKHNFLTENKKKTQIKRNVPLDMVAFENDEFEFQMDKNVENIENNIVRVTVKESRFFGRDKVIGEAAISFDKIVKEQENDSDPTDGLAQLEMPLIKIPGAPKVRRSFKSIIPARRAF